MRPRLRNQSSDDAECGARGVGFADRTIADLAKKQRGVVSRAQLLAVGVTSDSIKHRLRAGRLHRVHPGVYRAGHTAPIHGAREMAAVLACGNGAVVSHLSAAALLQLLPYPAKPGPVDITVAGRDPGSRRGIAVHRVTVLDERDVGSVRGVPVTTPARTILDLAAVLSSHSLERALAEAQVRRLVRRPDLVDQLGRNRGRRGTRMLRRVLALEGGPAPTRSDAERRLLRLVRAAELPIPRVNSRLGRYEVDFLWPEQRLVVEVDSFRFHSPRPRFERDRARDAALAAAGYTVIRVTWRQLVDTPEAVAARIAAALAVRR
jgi:very-short-patch-repair endonuclease